MLRGSAVLSEARRRLTPMGVSVDRAERVLLQGAELVGDAIAQLAESVIRERAVATRALLNDVLWSEASQGRVIARQDGVSDVVLVLLPDREMHHLSAGVAFQTNAHDDGTIRINVRTVSLTPFWAGLALFHELSHAYDFHAEIEPPDPSEDEYARGEARAFHLEMALLDAMTSGRLAANLADIARSGPLDAAVLLDGLRDLSGRIERNVLGPGFRPPASDEEMGIRDAFFKAAVLIASHTGSADPAAIESAEAAGSAVADLMRLAAEAG